MRGAELGDGLAAPCKRAQGQSSVSTGKKKPLREISRKGCLLTWQLRSVRRPATGAPHLRRSFKALPSLGYSDTVHCTFPTYSPMSKLHHIICSLSPLIIAHRRANSSSPCNHIWSRLTLTPSAIGTASGLLEGRASTRIQPFPKMKTPSRKRLLNHPRSCGFVLRSSFKL